MWRHNLLIAFRNFQRDKVSFSINLIGLSTGLACAMLIYMWVNDELSFDKFHENEENIYQVMQNLNGNENEILTWEWTPGILAKTLKEEMPEVDLAIQVAGLGNTGVVSNGELKFKSKELYAGKEFFELFSFELLEGKKEEVLKNKNAVVITEELGEKVFGTTENLIGKTIKWERNWENVSGDYIVSGVCKKAPANSSMQFDLLFVYDLFMENKPGMLKWNNSDPFTFITLKSGTDLTVFNEKIEGLIQRKMESSESTLFVRKYSDSYLYGKYENGVQAGGRIAYVKLFSLIAFFILIVACINFMNLSTAKASKKGKEVGVKKTIGASRKSLVFQYMTESFLLSILSCVLALSFVSFLLPQFNVLTNKELAISPDPNFILTCLGIVFLTGLLSGSYPAFYLSKFKPANILKGAVRKSFGEFWARKGLVVFQFGISVMLVVAVIVVYQQMQFIQSKNLGYEKDNVGVLKKDGEIKENVPTFLAELKKIPGVVQASALDGDMAGNYGYTTSIKWESKDENESLPRFGIMIVGEEIVETMGMEIIEGVDFSVKEGQIEGGILINEAAQKILGFEQPLGQTIQQRHRDFTVVGVLKDFHFESMYDEVKPCIMKRGTYGNNIYVKLKAGKEKEALAGMDALYGKFNPGLPFEFTFLDEKYQKLYAAENRVAILSKYFAGIAILISCLGLFGLAAFTIEKKSKEISIRKILGSSNFGIVRLLSSEFARLVLAAVFIAIPISYWLAKNWLDDFAFHAELKPWHFIMAGLCAILIAGITISYHSIRAAFANPVESLRSE